MSTNETEFRKDLESAINRCSRENGSNTPDFILAEFLAECLTAFEAASRAREKWYGKSLQIGGNCDAPAPTDSHEELVEALKAISLGLSKNCFHCGLTTRYSDRERISNHRPGCPAAIADAALAKAGRP